MRTNYVLVDYENLQPELLEAIDLPHFRVMVFMGANQTRVPLDFASQLQRLGTRAQYLRISGQGRNALDFHVAFYLGELLAKEPDAFFHLIAVDGGYDPLLQHLRDRKVFVRKYKSIADIAHVKAANAKTLESKVSLVRELLSERSASMPTSVKTLGSTISSFFPGGLEPDVVDAVVKALAGCRDIVIDDTKVTYPQEGTLWSAPTATQ